MQTIVPTLAFLALGGALLALYRLRHRRVLAARAREEGDRRWRTLFETSSDGVALIDAESRAIEDVNPALCRMTGRAADVLVGSRLDEADILRDLGPAAITGRSGRESLRHEEAGLVRADGSVVPVEVVAAGYRDGGRAKVQIGVRDISARKRDEAARDAETRRLEDRVARRSTALRLSEARYEKLVELSPVAILVHDGAQVTFGNPAACALLGAESQAELVGRDVLSLVHPADRALVSERIGRLLGDDAREPLVEVRALCFDGTTRVVELASAPFVCEDGISVMVLGRDVTERQRLDRLKDELIASVNHELRTPLTAVDGSLGLLSAGAVDPRSEEATELITMAKRNSERLLAVIEDLLDVRKMAYGSMELELAPMEIGPLVDAALRTSADFAAQHGVKLSRTPEAGAAVDEVAVPADAERLGQVLSHLLSNAIKFSAPGSLVTVELTADAETARLAVVDRGRGIPESFRSRIFKPFARAEAGDGQLQGGTGLGLSLSKMIVDRLGGIIDYESSEGAGTTFWVELPVARAAQRAGSSAAQTTGSGSSLGA